MSANPRRKSLPETDIDTGQPGASARAEFERRQRADDARRQAVFGRYLSPVVKLVAGERQSTRAWEQGGRGEERVGRLLEQGGWA